MWPERADQLEALQRELGRRWASERFWQPPTGPYRAGGLFVATGEPAWVAAVVLQEGELMDSIVASGELRGEYQAGLLALREGRLLHEAVDALHLRPDVLVVNATGRDHPRRAGLALHLGAACGLPSIGVTDRQLVAATSSQPGPTRGASAELVLNGELVGYAVRTRADTRPVVVHAAWRTTPETAREVILAIGGASRTPEPIRTARLLARTARAEHAIRFPPGATLDSNDLSSA